MLDTGTIMIYIENIIVFTELSLFYRARDYKCTQNVVYYHDEGNLRRRISLEKGEIYSQVGWRRNTILYRSMSWTM